MSDIQATPTAGITLGQDGLARCAWGASTPEYQAYHDTEWGFPVADDHRLFEKLSLEGFQAGLSWLTILRKREAFREVFNGFDYEQVAAFGPGHVAELMEDARIVRNRAKIEAVINNAHRAVELVAQEGSLGHLIWSYEPAGRGAAPQAGEVPAATAESKALARELKRRGWRFTGPTTVYAFMQAMGLVNDHLAGCHVRPAVEAARHQFKRP
jgi:DNA-3-methyladenine glycosylase I